MKPPHTADLGPRSERATWVAERIARLAPWIAIAVGASTLLGWVLDSAPLKGAIGVPIVMKANTAIAFLLCGTALRLASVPRAQRLRIALALPAAAIGGLTLAEHIFGLSLGIDQLLFQEQPGAPATASPGRMGPPAATSFLLLGTSLAFLDGPALRGRYPQRSLPLLAIVIALISLVGYALGAQSLYASGPTTGIAWPTAIALLGLGVGTMAVRPENRIVRLLCASNAGGMAARALLLPALATPLILVLAHALTQSAGWLDRDMGRGILAVLMMVALTTVVLITAYRLALTAQREARTEQKRRRGEHELADFFENASIGMHWCDAEGRIVRANRAALALLGYDEGEYVGRHVAELHVDAPVIEDILRRLAAGEVLHDHAARLRGKDGSIKHVKIDSSVLWEDGRFVHTRCFLRDVTQARAAEIMGRRLSAIVESSNDAIVGKDLSGSVTSWNQGAERLFGYTEKEMIGRSIATLIPEGRSDEELAILERIRKGEKVEIYEAVRRRKDGALVPVSLSISPILDADGHVIGASKIARDNTERKRIEAEREGLFAAERAARSEAERAARLRDEFLAVVSHELRTPLHSIFGWLRLLAEMPRHDPEQAQAIEAIDRAARAQAKLVEDLLDVNRIMTGRLSLEVELVDLGSAIQLAIATLRPAADNKAIRMNAVLDPAGGAIMGDPDRLQQVVWNLLSNAVKFTPRGGSVEVRLQRAETHAEITVRDDGIGIPPEFLPQLFQRFRQADSSTTRSHGGLGLGLSIVKNLVELHGGTVSAHSDGEGKGATFVVRLPLAPLGREPWRHAPARLFGAEEAETLDLTGVRVLVVDDDAEACDLVRRILASCHAEVLMAGGAEEGLDALRAEHFDVLVSDIGMPHTNGYDFLRRVRALPQEAGGTVPALALTAYARSEDRTRAILAGFQMHISKPIEPGELIAAVASFAGRTDPGE